MDIEVYNSFARPGIGASRGAGNHNHGPHWPEAHVEAFKALCGQGFSASTIMEKLAEQDIHYSRCALIGKAQRMGLVNAFSGAHGARGRSVKHIRRAATAKVTRRSPTKKAPLVTQGDRAAVPTDFDLRIPVEQRKQLIELSLCSCRWPVGDPINGKEDFFFCGGETMPDRPYCKPHMAVGTRAG